MSQTVIAARHRGREYRLSAWFRDTGDNLVLFVHGLGCSKESWRRAWSSPALYGCSLLAIDLPGFGASPRPPDFSYDLEDQAGLLAGVIDAHASRRVCVVAHSMGGTVATLLPDAASRRVDSLVLVEGRLLASSCGIASEAIVVGAATALEGLIVMAWQMMLGRPVSIDLIDVVIRAVATAIATFAALSALRRWEQRASRKSRGGRR